MEQLKRSGDYPVLFLTARGEDDDKFRGFGLGADDYIVKPFLPKELCHLYPHMVPYLEQKIEHNFCHNQNSFFLPRI